MEKEDKFIVIIKKGGWAGFLLILFVLSLYVWAILSSVPEDIIKGFLGGLGDNIKNVFSYFWYLFFNFILKNILAISTFVYATLTFFILRAMMVERRRDQGIRIVKEILAPFKNQLGRNIKTLGNHESPWPLINFTRTHPEPDSTMERLGWLQIDKENIPLQLLYNTYSDQYLYRFMPYPSIPTNLIDKHNKILEELKNEIQKLCRFTLQLSLAETFSRGYGGILLNLRSGVSAKSDKIYAIRNILGVKLEEFGFVSRVNDDYSSSPTEYYNIYNIFEEEPSIGFILDNVRKSTETYKDVIIRLFVSCQAKL